MRIFRKIVAAVAVLATAFCLSVKAQSQGSWPIQHLELTGSANGGFNNFTNLGSVVAQTVNVSNLYANTFVTTNLVSSNIYTKSEIDAELANSNNWNTAYSYVNLSSNGLNYLLSRSNTWDGTSSTVSAMPTQNWNTAYSYVNSNSNGLDYVLSTTGNWNTAYNWVTGNSNKVSNATTNGQANVNFGTNLQMAGSVVVTNPVAAAITSVSTGNWNTAYSYVNSNSNGLDYVLSRTSVWNNAVSTSIRFKAGLATNVSLVTGATRLFPLTNTVLASVGGSSYSNALARWYPGSTNKILEFHGGISMNAPVNSQTMSLQLWKNGGFYSELWDAGARAGGTVNGTTWSFVETVNTSTGDFYEVYYNVSSTSTTLGAGSNNWWYGEAK